MTYLLLAVAFVAVTALYRKCDQCQRLGRDVEELADENDRLTAEVNAWRMRPRRPPVAVQLTVGRDMNIVNAPQLPRGDSK